ncbi:MAG TPA: peptidoglycan -binding protein [Alphaproteobacteria bacterium]|jgi:chemotaxis protein MotB|nr:peptidoglycan -binding protein [Alphaproteobacteria bacterium]
MALSRRGFRSELNVWPGWVDGLSSLIIVVIFVLMVFVIAQAFLQQQLSSKDRTLLELNKRVVELNQMLGKERDTSAALKAQVATVTANLQATTAERDKLTEASNASAAQVQALSQQIADLTAELQKLNDALGAANTKAQEQSTTINDLTQKLNVALATKVGELAKYRSEFFGRLREVLGDRPDIRIVGDRFVFQSEVLFPSGSATLEDSGKEQLNKLAQTLVEISGKIPANVNWVLRVDGHTDKRPIRTAEFPSNWELSTARATAVLRYLIEQGVPANRLAAAGFGEFQPVDNGADDQSLAHNRRIELKFDQR